MIYTFLLSVSGLLLVASVLGFIILYLYFQKQFKYWGERNVPHTNPKFPFGNLGSLNTLSIVDVFKNLYNESKHERFYGIWQAHRPTLLVNDPELIKRVCVGDFMSFHDHGVYFNEKDDPLSANLFSLEGTAWRNLRVKLTPAFTSGKMKMMFPILVETGRKLQDILMESARVGDVIDVKEFSARFSTDIISSVAFGIEANSLENPDAEIRKVALDVVKPNWSIVLKNILAFFVPDVARLLKLKIMPDNVSKFFLRTFREVIDYRNSNNMRRNDSMQLLIDLYKKGYIEDADNPKKDVDLDKMEKFTFEQLSAQAFVFFVGGFETSATLTQFVLYELAKNHDLQNKLRDEINKVIAKHNGQITYEAVFSMDLLGRTIDETLRKYPPAGVLTRVCTKDYKVPDSDLTIEKGTAVLVSIFGLQMDERYFPNPYKFDPDRFTEEGKASRPSFSYIPFGDGPRLCIGQRFAQMQTRVGLVSFLTKFKFDISEKHTPKDPIEFDPKMFILSPKGGMHLKISLLD